MIQVKFSGVGAASTINSLQMEVSPVGASLTSPLPSIGAAQMDFAVGAKPQDDGIVTVSVAPFRIAATTSSNRYLVAKGVGATLMAEVIGALLRLRRVR